MDDLKNGNTTGDPRRDEIQSGNPTTIPPTSLRDAIKRPMVPPPGSVPEQVQNWTTGGIFGTGAFSLKPGPQIVQPGVEPVEPLAASMFGFGPGSGKVLLFAGAGLFLLFLLSR